MRVPRTSVAVLLFVALTAVGCSADSGEDGAGTGHNDTDVSFAGDMIQHHAQALQMVDLTLGKDLDPQVVALAEDIRAAQAPEIETMVSWLQEWDQPVPETSRDHANAHGDASMPDSDMPGMMSHEDLTALEDARGEDFQRMWLESMIEHHEGAIEMAKEEQAEGEHGRAVALAGDIVEAQQKEIDTMKEILGG